MSRAPREHLQDARAFALAAQRHGAGLSTCAPADRPMVLHAILYELAIGGEALGAVPDDVRRQGLGLPWRASKDMRNVILHAYWQIDPETVAQVVAHDLGPLLTGLDRLIETLRGVE